MEGKKMGEEDELKAVWFAAGTAVFMACIERALFTHWHVWVFLTLNLLLLAILFTSKTQTPLKSEESVDSELKKKKKSQESKKMEETKGSSSEYVEMLSHEEKIKELEECSVKKEEENDDDDDCKEEEDGDELSKEELNQRVEDFIARFRQHLASDAIGKSCGLRCTPKGILVKSSRPGSSPSQSSSTKYVWA